MVKDHSERERERERGAGVGGGGLEFESGGCTVRELCRRGFRRVRLFFLIKTKCSYLVALRSNF